MTPAAMSDYTPVPYERQVEEDADVTRQLCTTASAIVAAYDLRDGKRLDTHIEASRVLLMMLNSPRDGDMRGGDTAGSRREVGGRMET